MIEHRQHTVLPLLEEWVELREGEGVWLWAEPRGVRAV